MRALGVGIALVCLALVPFSFGKGRSTADDGLSLTLSIEKKDITVGQPIVLRLIVENRGKSPVRFVRPRGKNITRIHEHGWIIQITGPQGIYGLFPAPRGVEPIVDADIIELAPGEFVGADVNISHYTLLKQPTPPRQEVGRTTGSYRALLTYSLDRGGPLLVKKEELDRLFRGPVSSNAVEFETVKEQGKPNKSNPPDQE